MSESIDFKNIQRLFPMESLGDFQVASKIAPIVLITGTDIVIAFRFNYFD